MEDGKVLQQFNYRVVALWQWQAVVLLACGQVELFALLPTMKGATAPLLVQAIRAMKQFYAADESRFCTHLLWFDTLLSRTTTVSEQAKERTRQAMSEFESLLDSGHFVQQRVAKSRAEGLAEGLAQGEAKGEAKGLQEAVVFAVELRFPTLLELAQQKTERVKEPEVLRFVLRGLKAARDEEVARLLLDTLAA